MAHKMFQISSQYLKKNQITVTILDVINPVHYIVKETPDLNASSEAKNFLEAEESMQKYYSSFDQGFYQLPLKNCIIVVFYENKFYRGKVIKILNLTSGHLFKVYLVDYGVECSVTRDCIYKIEKDFLDHPFQAVNMKLLGMEPISLVMNSSDLSMSYGQVTYWDPSAEIYIHDLLKMMCNAYIEIKAVDEQCIYGSVFMCFGDNSVKCINEELISNTFACFDENCWKKVYKIEDVLENNITKYAEDDSSTPEHKKPDSSSTSDLSSSEDTGDFIDLRSSFISPSDGKVVATSSISLKATEPSLSNLEDNTDKVQEKCEADSSNIPVEKSPDTKASPLSRFQKLQLLNKKSLSSQSNVPSKCSLSTEVKKTDTERNLSYDGLDKTESSNDLSAVENLKSSSISPLSVYTSNNLCDRGYQSDTPKSPSSYVCEKKTIETNDALLRTPTSSKLKKLQELHRKRQNPPISNVHSACASDEHKLPSTSPSDVSENILNDLNVKVVEDSDKGENASSVTLLSVVETHVPSKLKKLQELHRKSLSNSTPSTDSSNSTINHNLCDTPSEKDISKVSDTSDNILNELNNNTSEQRKSSDCHDLKSSPVQPSVSKDMSCALEPAKTSKFKKLQELHKKRRSNNVSSEEQLNVIEVSSNLENNSMIDHKDEKQNTVCSNVIADEDKFSDFNVDSVSNVSGAFCDSKDMNCALKPAKTSKLKKLQELHKKQRSSNVSGEDHLNVARVSSNSENNSMVVSKDKNGNISVCSQVIAGEDEFSDFNIGNVSNVSSDSVSFEAFCDSKDTSCALEPAKTSKLKKLQVLHKKHQSNNVSSEDQLNVAKVSSNSESNSVVLPKDKKENISVCSNVIVDEEKFSNFNIDNASNMSIDSVSFKASCDSPKVSEVLCKASSPSSVENSPKQDDKPKAQTYASKRFQKLQELHRKRQSSTAQSDVNSIDSKDKIKEGDSTTVSFENNFTLSSESSLNRNNESINNMNLSTVCSDNDIESNILQDSADVSLDSLSNDNSTIETVPSKVKDLSFNPNSSNSEDVCHAAASKDDSKQESVSGTQSITSRKSQKLLLLNKRKTSSSSPNQCPGTNNVSALSEVKPKESEENNKASIVDGKSLTLDDLNSNCQVFDGEKTKPNEIMSDSSEISLREESKQVIRSEKARTLQRLQQKSLKKNIELQTNASSNNLSDSLNNNENFYQAKTLDLISQNDNSRSTVQSSEENRVASSALSKQISSKEVEEKADKRRESFDGNSQEVHQTSNNNYPNYRNENQNSPVSNAFSSSYVAQNKTNEKNTRSKTKKSPSNSSKSNLESEDSSPTHPKQSQILQEMLALSDTDDDLIYSISKKKRESIHDNVDVEENYIELSTQLKHSDPKTLEFNELSLWQKQKVPALQIGIGLINPILNAEDANFSKHIKQVLREIKFYGPSCIQSVIWPSIEKNRCMVAVGPPHSGKTVSYVLPLVSSFTEGKGPKFHNNGPSAIILCSSWLKAQAVYDLFYFFLGDKKMSIITLCTDGGHYRHKVISLINSCDVLIATPHCLLQYLKDDSIKFAQLDNLILDDSTALMNKHKKELKNILLNYMHAIKREGVSSQLLLFAERWNKNFTLILDKMMSNPLILFTSFLESAVYAKISIIAHVCQSEKKKWTLIDVVAKEVGKVVICTTNIMDAVDVHRFLSCEDVRSFLVNEEMEHYISDEVIRDWKSIKCIANPHCLVITDQVLIKRLSISDADCLIHYDIPPESRLQFGNRFSCIAEHFQVTAHPHCVSHILVTENDYCYATQIIEIIENSGGKPSEALVEMSLKQYPVEVSSDLLCPYFKAFGFCKERLCKNRHAVDSEKDKSQIVPFEGDIQGFVTQIVDASHYYVRLLKYLDPVSNKTVSFVAAYAELGFLLRDFYCSAPDEMKVDLPVVGENYVLAEENSLFYRVKVLKEVSKDASTSWKFLFLDEGWIKYYEKPVLYKLTEEIDLPEPLAVEVYVCNIITPDSCFEWNPQTSQLVSDLIKGKEIHGRIALCLGRTLWLEPIALVLPLPNSNEYVNLFKLNQKLIDCGHARQNKNHLVTLRKACSGKIPHPHVVKPKITKEEKVPLPTPSISHAFLECNIHEDVYVSSVKSPHQFYVQRAKFVECLDNLLDKMNDQIENRMLKKAFTLYKGMHCIAPFYEDDRYYRAVITDVFDSEVQLFYVDFGDNGKAQKSNIYLLPAEFLLLPFQAIECELAGIAAAHGGWTDSSVDALTTLTRDENGDMKILQLKAYSKTSCYEGGNHYVIDLWFNDKNLSEQLLQAGLGIPAEIPEITEVEPPPKMYQDTSPECSSDEEFDLNEKKLSSDEEDPEDKDTTALFYGYVAEMVMQAANLIPKPGVEITEVSSDEGACVNNANENDELKAQRACKDLVKLLPKMNLGNRSGSSIEQCSNSLRPLITWWDSPEQLNILINLKDIKMYQLVVTDTGLNFNSIIAGVQYSADEKFYDEIQSADARKYQTAQGINIIAKKLTPFKWPRFTKEKKKFLHIKYDLIHFDDSDTEEQTSNTKKQNIRQEYMDEGSSSSTDEDEKYVEPWKDFAQQKNPFSVLE